MRDRPEGVEVTAEPLHLPGAAAEQERDGLDPKLLDVLRKEESDDNQNGPHAVSQLYATERSSLV